MAEYPILPLFTDAFISDTVHLNATQTGAYLMLLMCAWRSKDCTIPNDDKILARYARMTLKEWIRHKEVILAFWHTNKDGQLYQKRLVDERQWANIKRDRAITAGSASALKRKERHSTDVAFKLQHKSNHTTPTPTTTLIITDKNKKEINKEKTKEELAQELTLEHSDPNKRLYYNGHVIKLNRKDYETFWNMFKEKWDWKMQQFDEWLDSRDDWLADNPHRAGSWYLSTLNAIKKELRSV